MIVKDYIELSLVDTYQCFWGTSASIFRKDVSSRFQRNVLSMYKNTLHHIAEDRNFNIF
jgi:hypothetical protein